MTGLAARPAAKSRNVAVPESSGRSGMAGGHRIEDTRGEQPRRDVEVDVAPGPARGSARPAAKSR
ncbi:hypothetical protein ACWDE9_41785, partial [Streptomyces olivaceoviridis]